MGTEILRPQDCLIEPIRVSPCRRRNYYGNFNSNPNSFNSNPRCNRKTVVRSERSSDQRKRQSEPSISKRLSGSVDDLKMGKSQHYHNNNNNHNIVMEKVTILRRGESLDSKIKGSETVPGGGLMVTGTDRFGPDPKMVPKHIRIMDLDSPVDMYAGSAFAVSPAPSSLPLPSFSKKKQESIDDSASRDLRRLLRLDF